jgi:hypothetical protein
MAKDYVHIGKRSWWSGKVTTLCGLTFASDNNTQQMFAWNLCPTCKRIRKGGGR